jgi:hypothetical protein
MELFTHTIVGVIIAELFLKLAASYPAIPPLFFLVIAALCMVLSHMVVDLFAKYTYHTKDPHPEDRFWVIWHIIIIILSVVTVVFWFNPYWWVIIFANLPDLIDWLILRGILKKTPWFHPWLDRWRPRLLPGDDWFDRKPALLVEVGLDLCLICVLFIWL